jgi:hypothetical protein
MGVAEWRYNEAEEYEEEDYREREHEVQEM